MKNPPKILLVEDESIIAAGIKMLLQEHAYKVVSILSSGEEAVDFSIKKTPDIILMDIKLKGQINGIEASFRIRRQSDVPIIFLTGNSKLVTENDLSALKPCWVFPKLSPDWKLFETIDKALHI